MFGFLVYYDTGSRRYVVAPEKVEVGHTSDFKKWFADSRSAKFAAERMNRFAPYSIKVCKQCGRLFWFDVDDQRWYKKSGLTLPTRCIVCRRMNKEAKRHETL